MRSSSYGHNQWTSRRSLPTSTTFPPPSNLHPTILSHAYHFLTSTCLSLMVKSRLIFTLNLPTNLNTYYNLHVILNTLSELFHLLPAWVLDFAIFIFLTTLSHNTLLNLKLILTNVGTTWLSFTKKYNVFTTSHVPKHSLPKTLLKQTSPNGYPLLSHIIQPFVLYRSLLTNTSTSLLHLPAAPTF